MADLVPKNILKLAGRTQSQLVAEAIQLGVPVVGQLSTTDKQKWYELKLPQATLAEVVFQHPAAPLDSDSLVVVDIYRPRSGGDDIYGSGMAHGDRVGEAVGPYPNSEETIYLAVGNRNGSGQSEQYTLVVNEVQASSLLHSADETY